jgi:hypothetical protein
MRRGGVLLLLALVFDILRAEQSQCDSYRNRTFVPKLFQHHPAFLWTFPGSGSGWVRLLIEHATGYYSGSVYGDESLLQALPGEYVCSPEVVIIKAHPTTHTFADFERGGYNHRCTVNHVEKAIMVIRNPFDAIWSDHNRKITRSHVGKILEKDFDRKAWVMNAKRLAYKYEEMWALSYLPFMKKHPDGYILIQYEDLVNPTVQLKLLETIMNFLQQPIDSKRLDCAFYLANHPTVQRPKLTQEKIMQKSDAYSPGLVCELWKIFEVRAQKYGYGIYRNYTCPP